MSTRFEKAYSVQHHPTFTGLQRPTRGNAASGYDGEAWKLLDEADQEREQVHGPGVAASFIPLGHEDIGASSSGDASSFYRLHLAYCDSPGLLGPTQPGLGIGKGKEDHGDFFFQHHLKVLGRDG